MVRSFAWLYYLFSLKDLLLVTSFWRSLPLFLGSEVDMTIDGITLKINSLIDYWTLKEVLIDDVYQVKNKIKKGDVVIDVGASVGDYSLLSEKLGAKKVLAYECCDDRLELIKKNLNINCSKNVKVFSKKAKSLDEIFQENNLNRCDFLKIDCEGCEYQLLKNSKGSIDKIKNISMEFHLFDDQMKKEFQKLKIFLEKSGFNLKEVQNPVHKNIGYLYAVKMIDKT